MAGFFYSGVKDITICYHCGLALRDWHSLFLEDDASIFGGNGNRNPAREHVFWNRPCEWVCTYQDNNTSSSPYIPRTIPAVRIIPTDGVGGFLRRHILRPRDENDRSVFVEEDYPPRAQMMNFHDASDVMRREIREYCSFAQTLEESYASVTEMLEKMRNSWEFGRCIIKAMTYTSSEDDSERSNLAQRLDETIECINNAIRKHHLQRLTTAAETATTSQNIPVDNNIV